jgi:hypothetical protein
MCTEDGESFACGPTDLGVSRLSKKRGRDVRKVVKDYGLVDCEDQVAMAWLNTRFAKDYPPMPKIPSGDGWISPGGDFYARTHGMSEALIAVHYSRWITLSDADNYLIKKGWYLLTYTYSDSLAIRGIRTPTGPQLEAMKEMLKHERRGRAYEMRKALTRYGAL